MKAKICFIFFNSLGYLFLYMPHFLRLGIAKLIAFILCTLDKRRKKDLIANLNFAYNNMLDEHTKQEIIKTNYLNLVYNTILFFVLAVNSKQRILNMIDIENPQIIQNLLDNDKYIVFVTAHYGNWEYATPAFSCYFNHKITAVARMTKYQIINKYLKFVRSRFNIEILDKKGAAIPLIKALKKDRVVGIVTDQNTADNEGRLVEFFSKKVRHTPIASLLAIKYNAKIVHFFSYYSSDYKRLKIKILPPIEFQKTNNTEEDIENLTQIQSTILEQIIKENPKEWLWFHRKFKNQYEEIYR